MAQHMNLNMVIARVADLEAARKFYGETLGLPIEQELPNFFVTPPSAEQTVSLGIGVGEPGVEAWWQVDDVDALHAALAEQGVRIVSEPETRPFGRAFAFADPTGNILRAYSLPR